MEQWQDQSIILSVRRHGENGAVLSLLTRENGRRAGYVRGAFSSKNRGTLEVGNIVDSNWRARNEGDLGSLTLELIRSTAARIMQDPLKLAALQSACDICDAAIPEKEGEQGVYKGLLALLDILEGEIWAQAYIMWEIALLKELGFALDLTRCAGGGSSDNLAYVSPKTGRAVSLEAGEPYKDKLLPLPDFLCPLPNPPPRGEREVDVSVAPQGRRENHNNGEDIQDILTGLQMTKFFLKHWVFMHHNRGLPESRKRLALRFAQHFAKTTDINTRNTDEIAREIHATG